MSIVPISRRMFLTRLGRGAAAVAVFGVAACSDSASTTTTGAASTTAAPPDTTTAPATSAPSTTTTSEPPATTTTAPTVTADMWQRVNLGFVSAYVLARNGRAAVVDTGVAGSAGQIESALAALDLGWAEVGDVILTHRHGDHIGSLDEVLAAATGATAHAGEEDIPQIASPRPINAVGDGDLVFGLEIIATPGHTPGHISVLDPEASVLVAGDALNGGAGPGTVAGPNPQFTPDMDTANQSAVKLAGLSFDTLYFGHGEPVESGADALLAELAASL